MNQIKGRKALRPLALATFLSVMLSACGGGGGGDDSTVVDPPSSDKQDMTLTGFGQVTDSTDSSDDGSAVATPTKAGGSAIANATVTVTVGSNSFTTTTDSDGYYEVAIEFDENSSDFVQISLQGGDGQSAVTLQSLLGEVSTLAEQAGADATLSNSENLRTNLTQLSTAEAALVQEYRSGTLPSTDESLAAAVGAIDGQTELETAGTIVLLVHDTDNFAFPEGVSDTLAFAGSGSTRDGYIEEIKSTDAGKASLQTAISVTLNDPVVVPTPDADEVPTQLLLTSVLPADAATHPNYTRLITGLDLASDGEAKYYDSSLYLSGTWSISGTQVIIALDTALSYESYPVRDIDGVPTQVRAVYSYQRLELTELASDEYTVSYTVTRSFPDNSELATETEFVSDALHQIVVGEDTLALSTIEEDHLALPVYFGGDEGIGNDVVISTDGGAGTSWQTTYSLGGAAALTAVQTDDGGYTFTAADGTVMSYYRYADFDEDMTWLLVQITRGDERYADLVKAFSFDSDDTFDFQPGIYYQYGKGNEETPTAAADFSLQFSADGSGAQVNEYVADDGSLATTSSPFIWSQQTDGSIQIERTIDLAAGQYGCTPVSSSCTVYDLRLLIPGYDNNNRFYWVEVRTTDTDDYDVTGDSPTSHLARYYDYASFDASESDDSIVGTWGASSMDGYVTFLANGYYLFGAVEDDPDCGATETDANGIEYGSYTWDESTGAFTATALFDTTGDCGLASADNVSPMIVINSDGSATWSDPGNPDEDTETVERVESVAGSLVGAWWLGDPATVTDESSMIIFASDGRYFMIQGNTPDEDGTEAEAVACVDGGVETGEWTYTGDSSSGSLTIGDVFVDTNGWCGLSDLANGNGTATITFNSATDFSINTPDGDSAELTKITTP